jgi:hypothetical protein
MVSKRELHWREWVLGEGRYAERGPRSQPRPNFGYGGVGQKPVPRTWWARLEVFISKRERDFEPKPMPPDPADPASRPGMLSAHYNVREFDCHNGRRVPQVAVPALARLAQQFLEPMRAKFGRGRVLSGYRPRDYNRKIGGASQSQHIYDDDPTTVAADLTFERGTPTQWAVEARRIADRLGYGGVGEYPTSGFVHMDNRRYRANWKG